MMGVQILVTPCWSLKVDAGVAEGLKPLAEGQAKGVMGNNLCFNRHTCLIRWVCIVDDCGEGGMSCVCHMIGAAQLDLAA